VKDPLSEMSYYSDLIVKIIDSIFTRYEMVFRTLWEHPLKGERSR
jgi:hypothetical protein